MEGAWEVNFKKDLPIEEEVNISIDGENYILINAKKVRISPNPYCAQINIVRGPKPHR